MAYAAILVVLGAMYGWYAANLIVWGLTSGQRRYAVYGSALMVTLFIAIFVLW